jgi:hypothetical protein
VEDAVFYPRRNAASVLYAERQGWIELDGPRSACLTEEGKRLIARERPTSLSASRDGA